MNNNIIILLIFFMFILICYIGVNNGYICKYFIYWFYDLIFYNFFILNYILMYDYVEYVIFLFFYKSNDYFWFCIL